LAVKGRVLGRRALEQAGTLFTPDTILPLAPDAGGPEIGLPDIDEIYSVTSAPGAFHFTTDLDDDGDTDQDNVAKWLALSSDSRFTVPSSIQRAIRSFHRTLVFLNPCRI
jgi:hypothetical protein